jgi:hypothetical protein
MDRSGEGLITGRTAQERADDAAAAEGGRKRAREVSAAETAEEIKSRLGRQRRYAAAMSERAERESTASLGPAPTTSVKPVRGMGMAEEGKVRGNVSARTRNSAGTMDREDKVMKYSRCFQEVSGHGNSGQFEVRGNGEEGDPVAIYAPFVLRTDPSRRATDTYTNGDMEKSPEACTVFYFQGPVVRGFFDLHPVHAEGFPNTCGVLRDIPVGTELLYVVGEELTDALLSAQFEAAAAGGAGGAGGGDHGGGKSSRYTDGRSSSTDYAGGGGAGPSYSGRPAPAGGGSGAGAPGTSTALTIVGGTAAAAVVDGDATTDGDDTFAGKQLVGMVALCYNGFPLRDATKATFQVFKSKMAFMLAVAIREMAYQRVGSNECNMVSLRNVMAHESESLLDASGVEDERQIAIGARFWAHISDSYLVQSDNKSLAFMEGRLGWCRASDTGYAMEDLGTTPSSLAHLIYRGHGSAVEQVKEAAYVMMQWARVAACYLNVRIHALMVPFVHRLEQKDSVVLTARVMQAHQLPMLSVMLQFIQGLRLWIRGCMLSRKGDGKGFETPEQCMGKFEGLVMAPLEEMGMGEAERVRHLLVHHLGDLVDTKVYVARGLNVKHPSPAAPVVEAARPVCTQDLSFWLVGGKYKICTRRCGKKGHMTTARFFERFPKIGDLEAWMRAPAQKWEEAKQKEHTAAYVKMSKKRVNSG